MPSLLLTLTVLLLCGVGAAFLSRCLTPPRMDFSQRRTAVLLILALGVAAHVGSFGNGFVWDDTLLIVEDSRIRNWSGWMRAFVSDLYESPVTRTFYYRPLQHLSYRLDYSLWGLQPAGYHLANVALHIANALWTFVLVRRLSESVPLALVCGALFVVHPIHTQAVTYIAGRADPLCGFFLLLAFWCYLHAREANGGRVFAWVAAATLTYAAALASKEFAVVFPALLLATEICLPRTGEPRRAARMVLRLAPTIALVGSFLLVRRMVFGAVSPAEPIADTGLASAVLALRALASYWGLLAAPLDLHMERTVVMGGWPGTALTVAGFLCAVALLTLLAVWWRRDRTVAFALVWFLVFFLPVSNLWPLHATLAEHWMYFASIGWLWAAAALTRHALDRWARTTSFGTAMALFFVFAFGLRTVMRNSDWRDEVTLYQQTIRSGGCSPRVYNNLGMALSRERDDQEAAKRAFRQALELDPSYDPALNNLGLLHLQQDDPERAIPLFEQARRLRPWRVEAHVNLAESLAKAGRINDAFQVFQQAAERFPQSTLVAFRHGLLAFRAGQLDRAEEEFSRAARLAPENAEFVNALGVVALEKGRAEEAIARFRQAQRLDRFYLNAHLNLALLHQRKQRWNEAEQALQEALRRAPRHPEFEYRLAVLHWRMGRTNEARTELRELLHRHPGFPAAAEALAQLDAGQPQDAPTASPLELKVHSDSRSRQPTGRLHR